MPLPSRIATPEDIASCPQGNYLIDDGWTWTPHRRVEEGWVCIGSDRVIPDDEMVGVRIAGPIEDPTR